MEPNQEPQNPTTLPPIQPVVENLKPSFLKNKWLMLGIIVFIFVTFSTGTYFLGKNQGMKQSTTTVTGKQIPTITPAEQSPLGGANSDETADWKTYTGNGFSFKYPKDFEVRKPEDSIIINPIVKPCTNYPNCEYAEEIFIDNNKEFTNIKDYIINRAGNITYSSKAITIGGISGIRTSDLPGQFDNDEVLLVKDNSVWEITLIKSGQGKLISNTIFENILSSFKFTDSNSSTDTSTWKTYKSNLEGLSFKYPSTWKATEKKGNSYEELTLQTPNGFEFLFNSSLINPDGGCDNCKVTYLEKVLVPNYKTLSIAEGNGASGNVIYLSDTDLKMGDSRLDWEIESKNNPDTRKYVLKGMFNNPNNNMTMTEFANTPEVQTTKQILRSIKYIN